MRSQGTWSVVSCADANPDDVTKPSASQGTSRMRPSRAFARARESNGRDRWDSAAVAHRLTARVLVVRAGRDDVVRPARTDRLLELLPEDAAVLDLPDAAHGTLHEDPAYWPAIEAFLT